MKPGTRLRKPVSDTHTTEIFRWDNGKWFY